MRLRARKTTCEHRRATRHGRVARTVRLSLILVAALAAPSAAAIEITANPPARAHGGIDILYVQGPHHDRDSRLQWRGGYSRYHGYLVYGGDLSLAPDTGGNSGDVSVYQDFYGLSPLVGVAWPAKFRLVATAGPTLILERIKYDAMGESETLTDTSVGFQGRLAVDYGFGPQIEITPAIGFQWRQAAKKTDLLYGLALAWNLL